MVKVRLIEGDVMEGLAGLPDESVQKKKTIKSISFSQDEILQSIVTLHTGPIQADVTFGMGNFYRPDRGGSGNIVWMSKKEIARQPRPEFCFDLAPRASGVIAADVCRLPLRHGSIRSIMFDPPFLIKTGPGAKLKERFGQVVGTMQDLWQFYHRAMFEISRFLVPGGWLVFKCQDGVLSGVNNFTHAEIYQMALGIGFKPVDLFILLAKHRMVDPTHKVQKHARKFHSYFWVFKKAKR